MVEFPYFRAFTPVERHSMDPIRAMEEVLNDYAKRASDALIAAREAHVEEFAISGAFVNELALAVGRLQVHTIPMHDGSLVISTTERLRVI